MKMISHLLLRIYFVSILCNVKEMEIVLECYKEYVILSGNGS